MTRYKINDIAKALSATVVGDGDFLVSGACEPADATPDQLAVAMDPRYGAQLSKGQARAAVLWQDADWQGLGLVAAILVDRPRLAMAALTRHLDDTSNPPREIHPTAIIDPSANIGANCSIGPYVVVGAGANIGENSIIGAQSTIADGAVLGGDCVLQPGCHIGRNVHIGNRLIAHSGVVIGGDGFSFVTAEKSSVETVRETLGDASVDGNDQAWLKIHSIGGVVIGDDVEIGANSSVDAGTIRPTRVGTGTKIDALVQVGHNVIVGRNCLLCAHVAVGGSATLGNGVVLGGQAGVADNITIGDGVIAGGASKILSNVPAGRAILGYPAVKIQTHIESYKALRRLPRFMRDFAAPKKPVSKPPRKD